jgi:hypothetical protein
MRFQFMSGQITWQFARIARIGVQDRNRIRVTLDRDTNPTTTPPSAGLPGQVQWQGEA